jgi:hypothetical protein
MSDPRPDGEYSYCALRVERRGDSWRVTWERRDADAPKSTLASPWETRAKFWPDLGQYLSYVKAFAFRDMGKIPLALNSNPRAGT